MIAGDPPPLGPGKELTWEWLNALLTMVKRCRIKLGANSGLKMLPSDQGTFLAAALIGTAQVAYTDAGGITARSGATAGFGLVYPVTANVVYSGGVPTCTLATSASSMYVFNFSATMGGIAGSKYCFISQDLGGNWWVDASEC